VAAAAAQWRRQGSGGRKVAAAAGKWWRRQASGGGGRVVTAEVEHLLANSWVKEREREAEESEGVAKLAAGVAGRHLSVKVYKIVFMSIFST
jgi:hypothetical protein